MNRIYLLVLIIVFNFNASAQQDAMYTHYMFNTLGVNPAYAGSRDALTVTALHRSQWVGFNGAPTTQTLTLHSPIMNNNLGVGLSCVNDRVGPISMTSFYLDLAYKIHFGDGGGKLAVGLKGGGSAMSGSLAALKTETAGDNAFNNNIESQFLPNFGFGIYYSKTRWYIGLSTPRLLENNYSSNVVTGGTDLASEKRHYFLIGGVAIEMNENLTFKPTSLVKLTNGATVQLDLTAQFLIKNKFWLAPMWRSNAAAGMLVGFQFTDQLSAGYSFDWSFVNKTYTYNEGSHEVLLRYDFYYNHQRKIKSPRYF